MWLHKNRCGEGDRDVVEERGGHDNLERVDADGRDCHDGGEGGT